MHVKRTSWGQIPTALSLEEIGSSPCIFLTCRITHAALTKMVAFKFTSYKILMMYVGNSSANGLKFEKFSGILYVTLSSVLQSDPFYK